MAQKETPEMVENTEINIDETASADTLKPGAGSGGTASKAETLATFTSLLAQLGKEDLTDLFNRTIASIGKEADAIPSGAAAKNAATVAMKGSVKEDIDEMFGEELDEELKEKATVVFEAAVNTRISLETARLEEEFEAAVSTLEEEYDAKLEEAAGSIFEDVTAKLDDYLNYVTEQWMEANQIAIDNTLRADIAEDFMTSLRNVFAEHYIKVPEERLDVFGEMKNEIETLKAKLNESVNEKIELETIINEATKEAMFEEVSAGLAETQVEKFRTLAEGIDYASADLYRSKLEIVKENYFAEKKVTGKSTGLINEEVYGDEEPVRAAVPANMSMYMEAISKSVK
jgi:hypothetical protein